MDAHRWARFLILLGILTMGFVVGLSPLLLGLGRERVGRPTLLMVAAAVGLVLTWWGLKGEQGEDRPKRGWRDFTSAGINSTLYTSMVAGAGYLAFLAAFWFIRIGETWFGWEASAVTVGFYAALLITLALAVAVWPNTVRLVVWYLYPGKDAPESVYIATLETTRLRWIPFLIVFAVLIVITSLVADGFGFIPNVLLFMLIVSAGSLLTPRPRDLGLCDDERFHQAVEQTAAAFETSGFDCVRYPITGDADIDPLLEPVHLMASRDDCVYAVEVKVAYRGFRVNWTDLSGLVLASLAVKDVLSGVNSVNPVFVLWYGTPAHDVWDYAKDSEITLIGIGGTEEPGFEPATRCAEALAPVVKELHAIAGSTHAIKVAS